MAPSLDVPGMTPGFVCLPLSLGIAALLWHFVEKPLLDRKARFVSHVLSVAQLLRLSAPKVA